MSKALRFNRHRFAHACLRNVNFHFHISTFGLDFEFYGLSDDSFVWYFMYLQRNSSLVPQTEKNQIMNIITLQPMRKCGVTSVR